jgi:DNA-binding CsgD family transcriptional regulator
VVVANVEAMERWAGDMAHVLTSAGLSRRDLDDRNRRFTWAELSALMSTFGEGRSDEEIMAFGEEYVNAFPGFRELASLLVSPVLLYRFVVRASPRYWSELDFQLDEPGARIFHVRSRAHASWTPNRTFFASALGMFRNLGTLVGAEPALVTVHGFSGHHNDFTVEVQAPRELRQRIREVRLAEEMATVVNELLAATGLREGPRAAALGAAPSVYDLKMRWGFTVAEARLARRMANGMSLTVAAVDLGVRHETARSQLKRVMEKTLVSRQADLVRVLVR